MPPPSKEMQISKILHFLTCLLFSSKRDLIADVAFRIAGSIEGMVLLQKIANLTFLQCGYLDIHIEYLKLGLLGEPLLNIRYSRFQMDGFLDMLSHARFGGRMRFKKSSNVLPFISCNSSIEGLRL